MIGVKVRAEGSGGKLTYTTVNYFSELVTFMNEWGQVAAQVSMPCARAYISLFLEPFSD